MLARSAALAIVIAGTSTVSAAQQPRGAVHVFSMPVPVSHFRERAEGFTQFSGIGDSMRVVIKDAAAWQNYWAAIHRPFLPAPPAPEVDFAREMIVLASMGTRPSAGFGVRIEGAVADSARLLVSVRQTLPGAGCALGAALTQPVDLARVPATPLPVVFFDRVERTDCSGAPALHRR